VRVYVQNLCYELNYYLLTQVEKIESYSIAMPTPLCVITFSFFLLWGGIYYLRVPALRPASRAGPVCNPMDGLV